MPAFHPSLRRSLLAAAVLALAFLPLSAPRAAGHGEPGPVFAVRIDLHDRLADLKLLNDIGIDVDGVYGTWLRAYVIPEEVEKLRALGFMPKLLPDQGLPQEGAEYSPGSGPDVPSAYHTYETMTTELQQIAAAHPSIARLYAIGTSVQGRTLWMMKISDNPDAEEDEPSVRYIAAMHGDEVVGKEMCIDLIHLLTESYGTDPRITSLVDDLEIWILPSMNPDGTALMQRYNANGIDLNRNFPDQWTNPVDSPAGRAAETQAVMNWGYGHTVDLSANYHGGSVVANYPYDGSSNGSSVYTLAPDDAVWVSLARTYSDDNPGMRTSNSDPSFTNGICNGADWYNINGGMQDWNYVWRGDKEITLEISAIKWPSANTLPGFWNDNKESMLSYLERAREGVRGIVRSRTTGLPLAATVRVVGNPRDTFTDPDAGDFHRMLLPGTYTLEVSSPGYDTARVENVIVASNALATRADVELSPLAVDLQPVAYRVADGGNGALDPGETSDLAVTLKDLGDAASGVSAELVPTGWIGTAARPDASYPDLVPGGTGESLAPYHAVTLAPTAAPGSKAGFALRWSSSAAGGTSAPFFVPVGPATCTTVASTDVPKAIVDRGTARSTLTVPDDVEITDVNVRVDITHPFIGDLHVRVISPSGVPVALHSRAGGSADDIHAWYDTDVAPTEPLTRLNGTHSAGIWTLEVVDGVPANTGSLTGFSVQVCGRPFEASLPPMRIADVVRGASDVTLRWWAYPGATSYKIYRSPDPRVAGSFADVTAGDPVRDDTEFVDATPGDLYWLVSGVGGGGEGPVTGP